MRRRWLTTLLLAGASLLGISLTVAVEAAASERRESFVANADEVSGRVTSTDSVPSDAIGTGRITVRYWRFGVEYESVHNVVSTGPYEVGDRVQVLVDRDDPAVSHIDKSVDFVSPLVADLYPVPGVAGGFTLAWLVWRIGRTVQLHKILGRHSWRPAVLTPGPNPRTVIDVSGHDAMSYHVAAEFPPRDSVEIAGPDAGSSRRVRSVIRSSSSDKLRFARGPVPVADDADDPDDGGPSRRRFRPGAWSSVLVVLFVSFALFMLLTPVSTDRGDPTCGNRPAVLVAFGSDAAESVDQGDADWCRDEARSAVLGGILVAGLPTAGLLIWQARRSPHFSQSRRSHRDAGA